jgi:SAM-dependent methyltransferase
MPPAPPSVAVVIPCTDQASSAETVARRASEWPAAAEVTVVGGETSLRRALEDTACPYVLLHDPDPDYAPDAYDRLFEPLLSGQADVVFSSRYSPAAREVHGYRQAVLDRLLTLASNALTGLTLTDVRTGLRAFRREVVTDIEIEREHAGLDHELAAKVAAKGWRIWEVPISYHRSPHDGARRLSRRDVGSFLYGLARFSRLGTRLARPRLAAPQHPSEDQADHGLEPTLHALESATNHGDWITDLLGPDLRGSILEVGAGHGTMTRRFRDLEAVTAVTAVEPSARAARLLQERFDRDPSVIVIEGYLEDVPHREPFDAAVLVNVLEHIEDDGDALKALYKRLSPGGVLALFVPAHEALYSRFDREIGHWRRYRRPTLIEALVVAGFDVGDVRYVNAPGALAWFVTTRLLGRRPNGPWPVRLFDRIGVPLVRWSEHRYRPRLGLSLVAIARRP